MNKLARLLTSGLAAAALTAGCGQQDEQAAKETADRPSADDGGRIFAMDHVAKTLDNGLRVVVVPTDYPDVVTIQIPVQTGSRNEVEEGKSGFAHFFEHMMFRGTENYSAEEYKKILKNAGADQNAYTSDDHTNYHITFTKPDLETVIKLEADRFKNLAYSEEVFRTEALAVKGEYLKNFSNPQSQLYEKVRDLAFEEHPYEHTTMGFLEDIESMPDQIEYARQFFDRWYRPGKTTVILAGDLDANKTVELVEKYWGDWEPKTYQADIPEEPPLDGPVYEHVKWDSPTQPMMVIAFHGPAFHADEQAMPAMDLLGQVYFSETSDLYQKLVVDEQVADSLSYYFPNRKDPNLLMVWARLNDAGQAKMVSDEIMKTVARARTELVSRDKLADIKSHERYSFASRLDNSESIGAVLARFAHFNRKPIEDLNRTFETYGEVTPETIRTLANEYLVDSRRVTVTLSHDATVPGLGDGIASVDKLVGKREMKAAQAEDRRDLTSDFNPSGDPVDVKTVELPIETSPLVDIRYLFNVGPALDPEGKKGLAALTARMIADGGSASHTIDQLRDAMFPMAANLSTQVDKEMTRFTAQVHKDNLERFYELAREQLLNPGWRESDFKRVKRQLINSVETDLKGNNDEELGKEVLYEFIYGEDHAYGSVNRGHVSDLESITLEDVKAFYREHYTPANLTVGFAGGYDDTFIDHVKRDLNALPRGDGDASAIEPGQPPAIDGHRARIVSKDASGVAVSFGFPIDVVRGDGDWVALWLARSWLGEHRSSNSHLYQEIRADRGMNYGDYAYIEYFPRGMYLTAPPTNLGRQQQIFQVWLRPLRTNNDAHFATRVAMHELEKLLENGLTQAQFESTRNFLDKQVALLTKTQSKQLGYALDSKYYGIGPFTQYVREGLADLTVDEVNRVIREHLQLDNIKYVFISSDAGDLKKRLVNDRTSPMEYNSKKPEELLAEDEKIQDREMGFDEDDVTIVPIEEIFK